MAYGETLADEVRRALSDVPFAEKRVFGGLAFMVNGKMCVTVNNRPDHIMMVRIDPKDQDRVIKKKGAKVAVMRGHEMPGWIFLTKDAIDNKKDFDYWIRLARNFNKAVTK